MEKLLSDEPPPAAAAATAVSSPVAAAPGSRGPFVDDRGITWDANVADYEVWMKKKSKWMMEWRSRFFVLSANKLFYCKDELSAPHGMCNLVKAVSVTAATTNIDGYKHCVTLVMNDETIVLSCFNEVDQISFVTQVQQAMLI